MPVARLRAEVFIHSKRIGLLMRLINSPGRALNEYFQV